MLAKERSVRVALLGYGLIRSDAMLSATVRACALLLGGVLGPRGDVCGRVESTRPLWPTNRGSERQIGRGWPRPGAALRLNLPLKVVPGGESGRAN